MPVYPVVRSADDLEAALVSTPIFRIGGGAMDRSRIAFAPGITALVAVSWCQTAIMGAELEGNRGIAARYPKDVGIAADPAVVFTEGFEEESTDRVFARWEDATPADRMSQ